MKHESGQIARTVRRDGERYAGRCARHATVLWRRCTTWVYARVRHGRRGALTDDRQTTSRARRRPLALTDVRGLRGGTRKPRSHCLLTAGEVYPTIGRAFNQRVLPRNTAPSRRCCHSRRWAVRGEVPPRPGRVSPPRAADAIRRDIARSLPSVRHDCSSPSAMPRGDGAPRASHHEHSVRFSRTSSVQARSSPHRHATASRCERQSSRFLVDRLRIVRECRRRGGACQRPRARESERR